MLLTKASAASNVESTVAEPKKCRSAFWPGGHNYQSYYNHNWHSGPSYNPISQQEEFSQANQLSSIEEDLAKVLEILEKFEVESDFP